MKKAAWYWIVEVCLLVNAIASLIVIIRGIVASIGMLSTNYFQYFFIPRIFFYASNCLMTLCLMIGFYYWIKTCITSRKMISNILKTGIWGTVAYIIPIITNMVFAGQIFVSYYIISPVCVIVIWLLCRSKRDSIEFDSLFAHISNWIKNATNEMK